MSFQISAPRQNGARGLCTATLIAVVCAATPVQAQSISGQLGLASEYVGKGLGLSLIHI